MEVRAIADEKKAIEELTCVMCGLIYRQEKRTTITVCPRCNTIPPAPEAS